MKINKHGIPIQTTTKVVHKRDHTTLNYRLNDVIMSKTVNNVLVTIVVPHFAPIHSAMLTDGWVIERSK